MVIYYYSGGGFMLKVETIVTDEPVLHDEKVNKFLAKKDIQILNQHFTVSKGNIYTRIEYEDNKRN